MSAADVQILEYTDPGCPWAFSAEPSRRRIDWLYGDRIEWKTAMVVLAKSPKVYEDKGLTPERQAESFRKIARDHGMPIDTRERPRMAGTEPACRAVVATRLNRPASERQLLRCLRVHHFMGELLDEAETIEGAAIDAEIDPAQLRGWMEADQVTDALEADMTEAREPMPAARILDGKLANWSGGRRYTCPSFEISRVSDGVRIAVPGFQPFPVYDTILANLVPNLERRDPAESVSEVLRWAGTPLASKEVAVVCDIGISEAREELGRVAEERHVGSDGFWTLIS